MNNINHLMSKAIELGLFDFEWYKLQHKANFANPISAFADYIRKSPFTDVSPSKYFDTVTYYENNHDAYEECISPLEHYIRLGKAQGRSAYPLRPLWIPRTSLSSEVPIENGTDLRVAIVLHIYYPDFVEKFANALNGVDFNFDLFVTAIDECVLSKVNECFKNNHKLLKTYFKLVPNHGRNFAFLIEFGKDLLGYDLFCHLHSKKSLYSGKEQAQWADNLIEYLVRDKHVLCQTLRIFSSDQNYGIYYPTSFWSLPTWVNHWLKNRSVGRHFLKTRFNIEDKEEFFSYPVGGMFWAKPEAIQELLNCDWRYKDFPSEPLPTDGTILHVIERILPKVAAKQGFKAFFYHPPTGEFTDDTSYVYRSYYNSGVTRFLSSIDDARILSFDIFDTIVRRNYYEPDYAKYLIPERAGLAIESGEFVKLRNEAELNLRKRHDFEGDVNIYEIYEELAKYIRCNCSHKELADLEFTIDLEMLQPKESIVEIINALGNERSIWFITDTYYTREQISSVIQKIGIECQYQLFVSSDMRLRKDNGTAWDMISAKLEKIDAKQKFIHIGDNVSSDSQIPGDRGIKTFHILGPLDKWRALDFSKGVAEDMNIGNVQIVRKWGALISQVGSDPFI